MHEMTIASSLLDEVLSLARQHNAHLVSEIEVEVGVMRLVVAEALQEAFAIISEGTPAAGARLKLSETSLRASCNRCHNDYRARVDDFRCPSCGQADVQITGGNDIIIKSVALDVPRTGASE